MPSRRHALLASATGILAGITGCSAIPLARPKMDLSVENFRNETVRLGVRFFRPNVTERSEALVYRNHFEIPPREDANNRRTVEDVAPDRPYRIEVGVGNGLSPRHYHYRPDCADDEPYDIGVNIALDADGGIKFTQATCSSDSSFL